MALQYKEFYLTEEIDAELLGGMIDESAPPLIDAFFSFLDVGTDNGDKIEVSVYERRIEHASPFVGFGDRTPLTQGVKRETYDAYPYHLKEGHRFNAKSKQIRREGRDLGVTPEGLALATEQLEAGRLAAIRMAWLTVLSEQVFSWRETRDPDSPSEKSLTMDYSAEFGTLTAASPALNIDSTKIFTKIDEACDEYFTKTGMFPDVAFVDSADFNTLKGHPAVYSQIRAQTTDESDDSLSTRDAVQIGQLLFVALRGKYLKPDGTLGTPLGSGKAIVWSTQNLTDGRSLLRHEKAANFLNNGNAAAPYYDAFDSKDPAYVVVRYYDNFVPVIAHREGLCSWQMW